MQQENQLTHHHVTAPKPAAIAGIVFSILLTISLVLMLRAMPTDPRDNGMWLISNGKALLLGLNLVPFAGIAFLWFIGVVRDWLGSNEDQFISTVFLGSGLLFVAMMFVLSAIAGSTIFLYIHQVDRSTASTYYTFGQTITNEILNAYMLKMAGVFMISTSTLLNRTRSIPKALALVGYVLAAILLFRSSHVDQLIWIALVFPLWVLLISVYMLMQNYRGTSVPSRF